MPPKKKASQAALRRATESRQPTPQPTPQPKAQPKTQPKAQPPVQPTTQSPAQPTTQLTTPATLSASEKESRFVKSCDDHRNYPVNLSVAYCSQPNYAAYRDTLQERSQALFDPEACERREESALLVSEIDARSYDNWVTNPTFSFKGPTKFSHSDPMTSGVYSNLLMRKRNKDKPVYRH